MVLNLFYEEPEGDRWLKFDRYPRRIIRRLIRGKPQPGGQKRVFLNLCAGLDKIGFKYRVNDYRYILKHKNELACIIGKPCVLERIKWQNPILLGASMYSHPIDNPTLFDDYPIQKVLVPGDWCRDMFRQHWTAVEAWPVGIDTELWNVSDTKSVDVLLYDKVRWKHDEFEKSLIEPIRASLRKDRRSFVEIRYGSYREEDFRAALAQCRTMIFLCEHETQGIAYQQALACRLPIFAWDRGGPWQDPFYYPDSVSYGPVTSVPYWDDRCGLKFKDAAEFEQTWSSFWAN